MTDRSVKNIMLHTFVVYVDNKPGVLNRVASLFRRRAFNIESLTVGHTETPGVSRMTVVVDTDDYGARRLEANLYKLVPSAASTNITRGAVDCARPGADQGGARPATRATQVMQLVDVYRARIVDVSPESLIIETTGTEDKIDSLLEVLRPYGVIEMVQDRPRRDGARHGRRAERDGVRGARSTSATTSATVRCTNRESGDW